MNSRLFRHWMVSKGNFLAGQFYNSNAQCNVSPFLFLRYTFLMVGLLLVLNVRYAKAQINYQISAVLAEEFPLGDPAGLDGATFVVDATFDNSQVWGEFDPFFGVETNATAASLTISGASTSGANGVYDLGTPLYFNGFAGLPDVFLDPSGFSFLNGSLDVRFRLEVPGLDGVAAGDPILSEHFAPANLVFGKVEYSAVGTFGSYELVPGSVVISASEVGEGMPGDMNCDGDINLLDVGPFVMALGDPAGYEAAFPGCDINLGDLNGDGLVNLLDVGPFVDLLAGP